jgi:hypothetical protein
LLEKTRFRSRFSHAENKIKQVKRLKATAECCCFFKKILIEENATCATVANLADSTTRNKKQRSKNE